MVFDDPDVSVAAAVVLGVACVLGCVLLAYRLDQPDRAVGPARGADLPGLGRWWRRFDRRVSYLAATVCRAMETPLFVLLVLTAGLAFTVNRAGCRPGRGGHGDHDAAGGRPSSRWSDWCGSRWGRSAAGTRCRPIFRRISSAEVCSSSPWTVWRLTVYEHLLPNTLLPRLSGPWQQRFSGDADSSPDYDRFGVSGVRGPGRGRARHCCPRVGACPNMWHVPRTWCGCCSGSR